MRVLGFGNKQNYTRNFVRHSRHSGFQRVFQQTFDTKLLLDNLRDSVRDRLARFRRHSTKGGNPALTGS
jgi:hypothetical protein